MAAISKEEYLKRYLSSENDTVKKKRRKKMKIGIKSGKSVIIDDDVNLVDIEMTRDSNNQELDWLEFGDENPLIFNETGTKVLSRGLDSIKKKEDERKDMWAPVNSFSHVNKGRTFSSSNAENVSPDQSPPRRKSHYSPDQSPPRSLQQRSKMSENKAKSAERCNVTSSPEIKQNNASKQSLLCVFVMCI